jgi:hypothetical protein
VAAAVRAGKRSRGYFTPLQGFFTFDRARDRYGGAMTKLALLALLVPLAAAADPTATTTTTTTTADGTTTTTTTTTIGGAAPGATAPVAPAPVAAAPMVDGDPCAYKRGRWRSRLKGRISIGFSKSHVELADDQGEGKQKSFVARLNGRRGWSIELELSRLSLDGGDTAKTGGISLVKTFGRRKLAPYVLAGGGGGRYETVDGIEQRMGFGEVGAGLMLRGRRFSIGFDMRRGVRKFRDADDEMAGVERVATPSDDEHDHDHYTRGRVLALVTF